MKKFSIILLIILAGCITEEPLNNSFKTFTPQSIGDGHLISTPSEEGIDSVGLVNIYRSIYEDKSLWSLRSFLVFRNGKLVSESYLKDDNDIELRI